MEVVPKLDTENCLNAIVQSIPRRSKASTTIKDNGTEYVEAEREAAGYAGAWNKEGNNENLTQKGIRWKFNPPAAPRFGRDMKKVGQKLQKVMYVVLGNRSVMEDVL